MACKYYIDNKVLNEPEVKNYIGENYVNKEDIKLTTLEDIANILAYSNSKLILPGNEVIYTTPDNQQFKTYAEASNHISELAKSAEDVDLSGVKINSNLEKEIKEKRALLEEQLKQVEDEIREANNELDKLVFVGEKMKSKFEFTDEYKEYLDKHREFTNKNLTPLRNKEKEIFEQINEIRLEEGIFSSSGNTILNFIQKNKEYEQSKEIIEEWKKVNNIQYNPEEIYSRGQEFSSVVGAYSEFDVNLMMQNLLSHIEDNEKAGGKFAISAYTKPIDKQIGHLEGGGGKIKFKLYPQSQDILWASNIDVYSGSVWDASEKVNKDKKSELLGVSYTKYPALHNVNAVQPNLAAIVDDLSHHHNELGITLTGNNFRLEYDEDIPYTTKKILDNINKILDQKYGKLVKPEIKETRNFEGLNVSYKGDNSFKTVKSYESDIFKLYDISNGKETITGLKANEFDFIDKVTKGIQPTQTKETLKESIEGVWDNYNKTKRYKDSGKIGWRVTNSKGESTDIFTDKTKAENQLKLREDELEEGWFLEKVNIPEEKEYTEQALINTKIAILKEVAKKYPRSLIRSEVKRINTSSSQELYDQFGADELPFQKVSKDTQELFDKIMNTPSRVIDEKIKNCL